MLFIVRNYTTVVIKSYYILQYNNIKLMCFYLEKKKKFNILIVVVDIRCEIDQVDIIRKQANYNVLNNVIINIRYIIVMS